MTDARAPDPAAVLASRAFLARIAGRYPILQALLYGSRARGDARGDSDIDLALIIDTSRGEANRLSSQLAGEAIDELLDTGLLISPIVVAQEDWRAPEKFPNPFFLRNLRQEGVTL